MKFKEYLLNENKSILSQRIGDILNALQDLADDPKNINKKQKAENIVVQIRRILHTKWPSNQEGNLLVLRRCAVNIMMSIDPKRQSETNLDLDAVIKASINAIQQIIKNLDAPINQITGPDST